MTYQHGKLLDKMGFKEYEGIVPYIPINDTPVFTGLVRMMDAYYAVCDHPGVILDLNGNKLDVTSPYLGYFNDIGNSNDVLYKLQTALNYFRKKQGLKSVTIYMVPDSYHDTADDADIVTLMFALPFHKIPKDFDQYKVITINDIDDEVKSLQHRLKLWKDDITKPLVDNDKLERSTVFNTKDSNFEIGEMYQISEKVLINDPRLDWKRVKAIVLHNMNNNRDYLINMKRYVADIKMTPVQTLYNYPRIYNESIEVIPTQYTDNLQLILSAHKDIRAWSDFGFAEVLEVDREGHVYTYTMSEFMQFLKLNDVDSEYQFAFTSLGYLFENGYYTELGIFKDNYYNFLDVDDVINATKISFNKNDKHYSCDEKGVLSLKWFDMFVNKHR